MPGPSKKTDGKAIIEEVVNDDMHEYHRTSASDDAPLTEAEKEHPYQLLQRSKLGEPLSSEQSETDEDCSDDPFRGLLEQARSDQRAKQVDLLERLRETVSSALGAEGFPDPFSQVIAEADDWRPLPENWKEMSIDERQASLRSGEGITVGWAFIRGIVRPLSGVYFAAEMASMIARLETLSGRDERNALLRLGNLFGQWSSRRHLSNVTIGRKIAGGVSDGGKGKGRAMAARKAAILREIRRLRDSGKSIRSAADIASKRGFGTSGAANRQLWARAKKEADKTP